MTTSETPLAAETKTCVAPGCGKTITRNRSSENRARWEARKYCDRVCMGLARRTQPAKPRKTADLLPAAAPARVVNGTWRPSAPGWPDQPVIPAHLRRAAG